MDGIFIVRPLSLAAYPALLNVITSNAGQLFDRAIRCKNSCCLLDGPLLVEVTMSQTGYPQRSLSWKSGLVALMFLAVGIMFRDLRSADDKKADDDADTPAVEINAIGEPSTYRQTPDVPTIYVWRTGETWHVQTKTKTNKHEFKGKITTQLGRVTKMSDFKGLEAKVKKKKDVTRAASDVGRLNDAKNQIDFKFHTAGGEDGFTFTVDKNVKTVTFDLHIDGNHKKDRIRIGAKDTHPDKVPFVLSMPEKDQPKAESDKEKPAS